MEYWCNFFRGRPKKRSRVHSFHDKPPCLVHTPLYKHIVRHNGKIAQGATVMYGNGKKEIFTKDKTIYIAELERIQADENWIDSLDHLHYVFNFIDFKRCVDENKECFIFSEMYGKEMFLRNIYIVKEPGCWGKKYD